MVKNSVKFDTCGKMLNVLRLFLLLSWRSFIILESASRLIPEVEVIDRLKSTKLLMMEEEDA